MSSHIHKTSFDGLTMGVSIQLQMQVSYPPEERAICMHYKRWDGPHSPYKCDKNEKHP
jgi:hypothetical protein